ncbi:MAG: hypothetical protein H7A51_15750 [Akkermansiaceae bacterium]|nr:hypothetical protein [Akkermansiaceae bacterium]
MKLHILLCALGFCLIGSTNVSAALPVFPNSIWCEEHEMRKAIDESYPGLVSRCYHFNRHAWIGILADEENKRVLFLLYPTLSGTLEIFHNDKVLASADLSPALIKTVAEHGVIEYLDIGRWIPMSKKDTLSIKGEIEYSAKFTFSIKYDPDRDWRSTISEIKVDEAELKKADAYHFTEDSLLADVRAVLKKKPTCRVKLKHNQILTVKPWKRDKDRLLMPMTVQVGSKISINEEEAEEFMSNKYELKNRLEGYVAVARAGAAVPEVKLRVTPNANDLDFRAVLNTLSDLQINTVHLEEVER